MLLPLLVGCFLLALAIFILFWIILIPGKMGATGATGVTGPAGQDAPGSFLSYPSLVENPSTITRNNTIYRLTSVPNNSSSNPLPIDPQLQGPFLVTNEGTTPFYLSFLGETLKLDMGMKMLTWGSPGPFIFLSA